MHAWCVQINTSRAEIDTSILQTLFEQSTDNGFKNSRKQESDKDDLAARKSSLEVELTSLASEAARLRNEIRERQRTVEREARTRQRLARERAETINKANLQLKRQIEAILSNKENQKQNFSALQIQTLDDFCCASAIMEWHSNLFVSLLSFKFSTNSTLHI